MSQLDHAKKTLRKGVKGAQVNTANKIARRMRSLTSWSRRIPRTVKVIGKGDIVQIIAGGPKAPHAPVFDAPGGKPVRHPVFARPGTSRADWTWVTQQPRPFTQPAIKSTLADADRELARVAEDAIGDIK